MRKKIRIISALASLILFCLVTEQVSAQDFSNSNPAAVRNPVPSSNDAIITELANLRTKANQAQADGRTEEAEQFRAKAAALTAQLQKTNQQRQLNQMDQDIARLKQLTKEAEEIRARIAKQSKQPEVSTPQQAQKQPQNLLPSTTAKAPLGTRVPRQNLPEASAQQQAQRQPQQLPSTTGVVSPEARAAKQNPPLNPQPVIKEAMENMPELVSQLRTAFNNYLERVQTAYKNNQGRFTNLQTENQKLRNENQQLRNENQQLRNRLQGTEPRRTPTVESGTFENP